MRMIRYFIPSLFVFVIVSSPSFARQFPVATVDYSADSYMETSGMSMTSKVFHTRDKERVEMNAGGTSNIMILRLDKKVSWMVMPEQKMYMETSLAESQKKNRDMTTCDVSEKAQGAEKVNGVSTTKSKIAMSCPDGSKYDGFMWLTKEGIVMKMDATARVDGNQVRILTELKNLKITRQDPGLFEVPADYQKMNMGDMFSTINEAQRQAQEDAEKKRAAQGKKKKQVEGGRSYTSSSGRSYTSSSGRSYTSSSGRSYTSAKERKPTRNAPTPANDATDAVRKLKGFLPW